MVTRAKRATNNKWDSENMTVLGCKVRNSIADDFKSACKAVGTSPNAVFRYALDEFMKDPKKPPERAEEG